MSISIENKALELLQKLIQTPSLSREEYETADIIEEYLALCQPERIGNNIICIHGNDTSKPTILLNSHHDTVKPVNGWVEDPFGGKVKDNKLIGLGSNDAGASLVCLLHVYLELIKKEDLPFNLVFVASAEEEISGSSGIASVIPALPAIDLAIVGEPTGMRAAVAERGLIVLDCTSKGKSGHAARNEGVNAIHKALKDIDILSRLEFEKVSDFLGPVKLSVTQIEAGTQHNVVPDTCTFVVDVRTQEHYSNAEIVEIIKSSVEAEVVPRSLRLSSSGLHRDHPGYLAVKQLGIETYGSPTLSDQALMDFPSIKMGPGESERSHTADEFIFIDELKGGIEGYLNYINHLMF